MLEKYVWILKDSEDFKFLEKYLNVPSLLRLKKIGYFCGMDYASKSVYDFSEYVSRYDHSLNVALIVYSLTKDKKMTLAGLFHDVSTPCFSHVIDYMNKDYLKQDSTEEYTEDILNNDEYLKMCLKEDRISLEEISNFKEYSLVDNERPKLCADRLDGVILPGLFWTRDLDIKDLESIIKSVRVYKNSDNEQEIGFNNLDITRKILEVSENIDIYCHSNYDNYMMSLLASITKRSIDIGLINYKDLYILTEEELFTILKNSIDGYIQSNLDLFLNIRKENIPRIKMPPIKKRILKPLVNGGRIK